MKFVIAATFAAAASADLAEDIERAGIEISCAFWKGNVAASKGLTAETVNDNVFYKTAEGEEFTAWAFEDDYADSGCPVLSNEDGAFYLTAGAALATVALAF